MLPLSREMIASDIPCAHCHYNLRGLSPDSRCPECAADIATSIVVWEDLQKTLGDIYKSDPRGARRIAVGALISIFVFILLIGLAIAPAWFYQWKSPQRKFTLGVACTAWVLTRFAAWRLTTPTKPPLRRGNRVRVLLRVAAMISLAAPFVFGPGPHSDSGWIIVALIIIWLFVELAASTLWFVHAKNLVRRCGGRMSKAMGILAIALAILAALIFVGNVLTPALDQSEDSLSAILGADIWPYGPYDVINDMVRDVIQLRWPFPLEWIAYLLPIGALILHSWLVVTLCRAVKTAREPQLIEAAPAQITAASSRP